MKNRIVKAAGLSLLVLGALKLNDSFSGERTFYLSEGQEIKQVEELSDYEEAARGPIGDIVALGVLAGGAYLSAGSRRRE